MGSILSKRKAPEDEDSSEAANVHKKARVELQGNSDVPVVADTDVVVVVGTTTFEERRDFLCCHSGYFQDAWRSNPQMNYVEFANKDPKEWELLKSVLNPLHKDCVNQDNYSVLLPWFDTLRCEDRLLEADNAILKMIVEPLLAKEESKRSPQDVSKIVTVLEHCVTFHRNNPRDSCICFLLQVLSDARQPFAENEILRIVCLITKDKACQWALWKMVKHYLPDYLASNGAFPRDNVILATGNPLLLNVIVTNMKLKTCMHQSELYFKRRQTAA
jgi:hypothetical protein